MTGAVTVRLSAHPLISIYGQTVEPVRSGYSPHTAPNQLVTKTSASRTVPHNNTFDPGDRRGSAVASVKYTAPPIATTPR